jgi:hypothetical protein
MKRKNPEAGLHGLIIKIIKMIKFSKTIINFPDGHGYNIKNIRTSYYNTEDPTRTEFVQDFVIGQVWSRGDEAGYRIEKLILELDRHKNTQLIGILRKMEGPQLLNVNLLTLIKFWTLLDFNPNYAIIKKDTRFEDII